MLHGMCGEGTNAPCMTGGKCCKHFPKSFSEETVMPDCGRSPTYRRPKNGRFADVKQGRKEHNFFNDRVVPFNAWLLRKYRCHINIEIVATSNVPKYLFMYITNVDMGISHSHPGPANPMLPAHGLPVWPAAEPPQLAGRRLQPCPSLQQRVRSRAVCH